MFVEILNSQLYPPRSKDGLDFHCVNVSLVMTYSYVQTIFRDKTDRFLETFRENDNKKWEITFEDLAIIEKINNHPFQHMKILFMEKIRQLRSTLETFLDICLAAIYMIPPLVGFRWQKRKKHGEKESYFQYRLEDMFIDAFCGYSGSFIRQDARLKGKLHADYILYDSRDISNYMLIEFAANLPKGRPNDGITSSSQTTVYGYLNRLCLKYSQHDIVYPDQTTGIAPRTLRAECSKMWFLYFFNDYTRCKEVVDIFEKNDTYGYNNLNVLLCYWNPKKQNHLDTYFKKSRGMTFISSRSNSKKNNGCKSVETGAIKRSGDDIVEDSPSKKKKVENVCAQ